ncbi:hypothetical protein H0E87_027501, partial [Populus deltoides]
KMRAELGGATAVVGRSYCCYGARWRPALMVFLRCCCSWVSGRAGSAERTRR